MRGSGLGMDEELARRRALTFRQAEGIDPLPRQLERTEVSQQLRSLVFNALHRVWSESSDNSGYIYRKSSLYKFLQHKHLYIDFGYDIEFDEDDKWRIFSWTIKNEGYPDFYELIQQICRFDGLPYTLSEEISGALIESRSAFRLIDGVLIPFASQYEADSYIDAINAIPPASPVRKHLRASASALSEGRWADSVREAIHSVESVARQITGADSLGSALNQLGKAAHIHSAMNEGFKRLYGYTSDQSGIRHALLEDGDAKVTEADAMFMLGACASFVTYLTTNARKSGLLNE